ncbi:hypothetical protein HUG17_10124 [Dermatophagoides farinae]|uniref:MADF domain-containing protein n=1 Tax=Dermatophagoides farinae TaxID=6954 RepID=A0A9D4SJ19_DERFA|nr:hypothetical protein HUG17_10124 [Dermatophagoides farinae]
MHRLTFEQEKELIDYFRINPSLWNTKDKDYNNRTLRQEKLDRIAELLQLTRKDVYEKYRNLRTTFFREHKRVTSSPSSTGGGSSGGGNNDTATDAGGGGGGNGGNSSSSNGGPQHHQPYVSRWRHYTNMLFLANNHHNNHILSNGEMIIQSQNTISNTATNTTTGTRSLSISSGGNSNRPILNNNDDSESLHNGHDIDFVDISGGGGGSGGQNTATITAIHGQHHHQNDQQQQHEVIIINAQDAHAAINGAKSIHLPLSNVGIIGTSAIAQRIPCTAVTNGSSTAAMGTATISTLQPTTFSVIQAPSVATTMTTTPTTNTTIGQTNVGGNLTTNRLTLAATGTASHLTSSSTTATTPTLQQQQQTIFLKNSVIGFQPLPLLTAAAATNSNTIPGISGSATAAAAVTPGTPTIVLTSLANAVPTLHSHHINSGNNGGGSHRNRQLSLGTISPIQSQQQQQQLVSSIQSSSPPTARKSSSSSSTTTALNYFTPATKDHHHSHHNQQHRQQQNSPSSFESSILQLNSTPQQQLNSTIRLSSSSSSSSTINSKLNFNHHQDQSQQQTFIFTNASDTPVLLNNNNVIVAGGGGGSLNSTTITSSSNNSSSSGISSIDSSSTTISAKTKTTSTPIKSTKILLDYDEMRNIIRTIVNEAIIEYEDEDMAFCRSLAASLRTIDDRLKKDLTKLELQKQQDLLEQLAQLQRQTQQLLAAQQSLAAVAAAAAVNNGGDAHNNHPIPGVNNIPTSGSANVGHLHHHHHQQQQQQQPVIAQQFGRQHQSIGGNGGGPNIRSSSSPPQQSPNIGVNNKPIHLQNTNVNGGLDGNHGGTGGVSGNNVQTSTMNSLPQSPQINWGKCPELEPSEQEKLAKANVITKCLETTALPANITRESVEQHREQIAACALRSEGWFTQEGGYDFGKAEKEIKNKRLQEDLESQVLNYHSQCRVESEDKYPSSTNSSIIAQIQLYQACMDYFISDVCGIEVNDTDVPQF